MPISCLWRAADSTMPLVAGGRFDDAGVLHQQGELVIDV
jgi:hypothetical protein